MLMNHITHSKSGFNVILFICATIAPPNKYILIWHGHVIQIEPKPFFEIFSENVKTEIKIQNWEWIFILFFSERENIWNSVNFIPASLTHIWMKFYRCCLLLSCHSFLMVTSMIMTIVITTTVSLFMSGFLKAVSKSNITPKSCQNNQPGFRVSTVHDLQTYRYDHNHGINHYSLIK